MAADHPKFTLISASDLHDALQSAEPPLVLEACVPRQQARSSYLPGAVELCLASIDVYEDDEHGHPVKVSGNHSLKPPAELRAALEASGIHFLQHVVVLTQAVRAGGLDLAVAGRLCWTLAYAGVSHVSLLADGVPAWTRLGHAVATAPALPPAPTDFFCGRALPFPLRPELNARTAEVREAVAGSSKAAGHGCGVQLADVRSWREYVGDGHDYPFPLPHGRIPGALWAHWGPSTYVGGDFFRHSDGALHPLAQTAALWRDWGLCLGGRERIIFYCGSGWRSAVAWCLAQLLGHTNCASYDGGFLEWSMLDPEAEGHPIVHGSPQERTAVFGGRVEPAHPQADMSAVQSDATVSRLVA